MHAHETIELAAVVASNGSSFIQAARRVSHSGMEMYWTASKCRLDRWAIVLKRLNHPLQLKSQSTRHDEYAAMPVLREILTSEILTRVWTAVVVGFDQFNNTHEASPLARSVLLGHLEARNRTLQLMVSDQAVLGIHDSVALNRLRRLMERWTDMLLAFLWPLSEVRNLAFDVGRVEDFAGSLQENRSAAWTVLTSSMRSAFRPLSKFDSPNADLNQQIVSSTLSCFGPELFDSTGLLPSLWQTRLYQTAADTEGMIEQILSDNEPSDDEMELLDRYQSGLSGRR